MQAVSITQSINELLTCLDKAGRTYMFSGTRESYPKWISIHSDSHDGLFLPVKGAHVDGHKFIVPFLRKSELNTSLCAFSFRDEIPTELHSRIIFVEDPVAALQAMARTHRSTFQSPVIGITGSYGKTTFKALLAAVLRGESSMGNLNSTVGLPLSLLHINAATSHPVCLEMGISEPGEFQTLLEGSAPNYGVITHVGPTHLTGLESVSGIIQEKGKLAEWVSHGDGYCWVSESYQSLFPNFLKSLITWVSMDYCLKGLILKKGESSIQMAREPEFPFLKYGLSENVIRVAMAVSDHFSVSPEQFMDGLWQFSKQDLGLRGGLSTIGDHHVFLDCYNASPNSFLFSLERAAILCPEGVRPVGWYAGMAELGPDSLQYHVTVLERIVKSPLYEHGGEIYLFGDPFSQAYEMLKQNMSINFMKLNIHVFPNASDAGLALGHVIGNANSSRFFHVKGSRKFKLEAPFNKVMKSKSVSEEAQS